MSSKKTNRREKPTYSDDGSRKYFSCGCIMSRKANAWFSYIKCERHKKIIKEDDK